MKKFITTLFILCGLAASAQAAVIVGVEAGYLVDSEEEYITGRLGFEVAQANSFSHQLELEIGYTDTEDALLKGEIVPVMANYRFVAPVSANGWSYHLGAGLGLAWSSIDGVSVNGPVRLRDESFAVQGFAGVSYHVNPSVAITAGARYLWIDDVTFAGQTFDVGDDVALSLGVTFKF